MRDLVVGPSGLRLWDGSLDGWTILAMIAFALCVASAIWILVPHAFVFAFRGQALLGESDQLDVSDVAEA